MSRPIEKNARVIQLCFDVIKHGKNFPITAPLVPGSCRQTFCSRAVCWQWGGNPSQVLRANALLVPTGMFGTTETSRQKGLWKAKRNTTGDRCMADAYGFLYSVFNAEVVRAEVGLAVFLLTGVPRLDHKNRMYQNDTRAPENCSSHCK